MLMISPLARKKEASAETMNKLQASAGYRTASSCNLFMVSTSTPFFLTAGESSA